MRDFNVAEDGPRATATLLDLLARCDFSGQQVHDANIVATMLEHGLRRLLTFNAANSRRFAGLVDLERLAGAMIPLSARLRRISGTFASVPVTLFG